MHEQLCETIKKHYDAILPHLELYRIKEVRYKRLLKILERHQEDEAALGLMLSFMQCLIRDHELLQKLFDNPLYRSDPMFMERAMIMHHELPELKQFRSRRLYLRDNLNYYLGKNHVKANKAKTKHVINTDKV